jgi:hypothetical protein
MATAGRRATSRATGHWTSLAAKSALCEQLSSQDLDAAIARLLVPQPTELASKQQFSRQPSSMVVAYVLLSHLPNQTALPAGALASETTLVSRF